MIFWFVRYDSISLKFGFEDGVKYMNLTDVCVQIQVVKEQEEL